MHYHQELIIQLNLHFLKCFLENLFNNFIEVLHYLKFMVFLLALEHLTNLLHRYCLHQKELFFFLQCFNRCFSNLVKNYFRKLLIRHPNLLNYHYHFLPNHFLFEMELLFLGLPDGPALLISETDAKELSSLPRAAEESPRFASISFKTPSKRSSSSSDFFIFLLIARPIPLTDPPAEPLLSSKPPQSSSSSFF